MTKYISCADTAKALREALKASFPGVTFGVRSKTYSGGASIRVSYVDGPNDEAVDKVAKPFAGASFDGMIDLKSYHTSVHKGEEVHWGADYVFVDRDLSEARRLATQAALVLLDDRRMNNLEAAMGMGRFGHYANHQPMTPDNFDWALFVRKVAFATLDEARALAA